MTIDGYYKHSLITDEHGQQWVVGTVNDVPGFIKFPEQDEFKPFGNDSDWVDVKYCIKTQ